MKVFLAQPEVQKKLDELFADEESDKFKRTLHLSQFLMAELYPHIIRHWRIPVSKAAGLQLVPRMLWRVGSHVDLMEQQLQVETLMKKNIQELEYLAAEINKRRKEL